MTGIWAFARRALFRPTMIYLATSALTKVGALFLLPFYARSMTPDAYGDYALALTVLSLGPAFVLGLPTALTKSYFDVKDPTEARHRYGGVAKLLIIVATLVAGLAELVILLSTKTSSSFFSRESLTYVTIATWGTTLLVTPIQFSRDTQRPAVATIFQLLEFALSFGLGLSFTYVLQGGLTGALRALAVTYGTLGLLSVAHTFYALGGTPSRALSSWAVSFSVPYVPHFLAVWVQGVAERWVMKATHRETVLGAYSIGGQLAAPVNLFVLSWNLERSALTGELYREHGTSGLSRELGNITKTYLLISVVPSILISILLPVIPMMLGARYDNVALFVPLLLIAVIIDACYCPPAQVAYYTGHSGRIATATIVSAVAAVGASVILVPLFGVWGAILSRILSATVRTGAMWYVARKVLSQPDSQRVTT